MMWRGRFRWLLVLGLFGLLYHSSVVLSAPLEDAHAIVQRMAASYDGIQDYTAVFLKRERIQGKLLPLETIELRFQEPHNVYMAWQEPYAGRIIAYVEGENDHKIHVNPGGLLRFLRVSLDPVSSLAMQKTHHSVLQAGLRKTIDLLMQQYQHATQGGPVAVHFRGHGKVDNRPAYHLEFICTAGNVEPCYAHRGDIWIDHAFYLPTRLQLYTRDNQLYAYYEYRRLQLNPGLSPEDFRIPTSLPPQLPAVEARETSAP